MPKAIARKAMPRKERLLAAAVVTGAACAVLLLAVARTRAPAAALQASKAKSASDSVDASAAWCTAGGGWRAFAAGTAFARSAHEGGLFGDARFEAAAANSGGAWVLAQVRLAPRRRPPADEPLSHCTHLTPRLVALGERARRSARSFVRGKRRHNPLRRCHHQPRAERLGVDIEDEGGGSLRGRLILCSRHDERRRERRKLEAQLGSVKHARHSRVCVCARPAKAGFRHVEHRADVALPASAVAKEDIERTEQLSGLQAHLAACERDRRVQDTQEATRVLPQLVVRHSSLELCLGELGGLRRVRNEPVVYNAPDWLA